MEEKTIYTRKLGIAVARKARNSSSGIFHIIPSHTDKWGVVAEGSVRPLRAFSSKNQAIMFAKRYVLLRKAGEIVVHGADGSVLTRVKV